MIDWTRLSPEEMERRRASSIIALKEIDRTQFDQEYQETCDRIYWQRGQCCAGCDHWQSDMGLTGACAAAGIVPGADVLRSMGILFATYTPAPGLPFTRAASHCGKFSDEFDWSSLDADYLHLIGAAYKGRLRHRPSIRSPEGATQ